MIRLSNTLYEPGESLDPHRGCQNKRCVERFTSNFYNCQHYTLMNNAGLSLEQIKQNVYGCEDFIPSVDQYERLMRFKQAEAEWNAKDGCVKFFKKLAVDLAWLYKQSVSIVKSIIGFVRRIRLG